MDGIILHNGIANGFEVIDPSSHLGKDVPRNDLFAGPPLEPPCLLPALLFRLVG
jgi:hypothetical protein